MYLAHKLLPALFSTLLVAVLFFQVQESSANESNKNKQKRGGPPPFMMVNSPKFNSDGTVTFRIWAPSATDVKLNAGGLLNGAQAVLAKTSEGVWSTTVKPSKAGLYKYQFSVDQVNTVDPKNIITYHNSNLILIPGKEAEFFAIKQVPHGAVHKHLYHSDSIGTERPLHVYTPPDYYSNREKKYPVLFLFHGSGDTDESWIRIGKADAILDNLIAAGLVKPMIVVIPYGHTVEPGTSGWPFVQEKGDFIEDFLHDIVPFVERTYRVSFKPKDRALAGLSMGGYHSLKIGLNHLDKFGNIGVFSWGKGEEFLEKHAPAILANPEEVNRQLEQLWIACGKSDFLFKGPIDLDATLTKLGIKHTFVVSEGGHTWSNWRQYLHQYAQLLFED